MKRIKITLPKGGIKEFSKVIGETTYSPRVKVSPASYEFKAEANGLDQSLS